jgi:hypothetical protein
VFLNGRNYSVLVVRRGSPPRASVTTDNNAQRGAEVWAAAKAAAVPSSRPAVPGSHAGRHEVDAGEGRLGRNGDRFPARRLLLPLGIAAVALAWGAFVYRSGFVVPP